jgi:hypothetical protein
MVVAAISALAKCIGARADSPSSHLVVTAFPKSETRLPWVKERKQ